MLQKLRKFLAYLLYFTVIFPLLFILSPTAWVHGPLALVEKLSFWIHRKVSSMKRWAENNWNPWPYEKWLESVSTSFIKKLSGEKTREDREKEMKEKIYNRRSKRSDSTEEDC